MKQPGDDPEIAGGDHGSNPMAKLHARGPSWFGRSRAIIAPILPQIFAHDGPLDYRIMGRALLQAAAVGVACGLLGALFLTALDHTQRLLLESLAGYTPLCAVGETCREAPGPRSFRPWLLVLLPAAGGLACGLLTRRTPEARGGGGDTMIRAFHQGGGVVPARLIPIKMLASVFSLGTGGAGGREGPTMLVGGAAGSVIGGLFAVSARERRILMLAGVAAGISAVFRTPLGAALLAVEVLYRDGFESDALIPAILASVVSYSVMISIHGQTTLFGHAADFPFIPAHLPLYGLLAVVVALLAIGFLRVLRLVRRTTERLRVPPWTRPALGGLALGLLVTPILMVVGQRIGHPGQGLGILGGGYGAVQLAISGASWLPQGWACAALLATLSLAKLVSASLTIGSGGSAGDFAPSLAIGGLLGGAFGTTAQLLLGDPRIEPGAFALVGMGAFYGGLAHVPLSALVLVCEMAGNYDLLVPLMLALGISSVALRRHTLYEAQVPTQRQSPVYQDAGAAAAGGSPDPGDAQPGAAPDASAEPEPAASGEVAVLAPGAAVQPGRSAEQA
jgi:CIC family chloride channel protein